MVANCRHQVTYRSYDPALRGFCEADLRRAFAASQESPTLVANPPIRLRLDCAASPAVSLGWPARLHVPQVSSRVALPTPFSTNQPWSASRCLRERPLHELDNLAVQTTTDIVWSIMLYVFAVTQLAGPPAVGQLSGGMRVHVAGAVECHFLEAVLQGTVRALLVPKSRNACSRAPMPN